VRPFFFGVGALRGMSSKIDVIGAPITWQISYSRAALMRWGTEFLDTETAG
jgi:hypothetical protein